MQKDLTGILFGRLTVLRLSHRERCPNGVGKYASFNYWSCLCSCGTLKNIREKDLLKKVNATSSCGCLRRDTKPNLKHGMYGTKVYQTWDSILDRIIRRPHPRYGGRGISICDRWLEFENFYADMGNPPTRRHSIERINFDGDYCPENCKWALPLEQANNRSDNRLLTFQGKTQTVSQWARDLGLKPSTIYRRLNAYGFTPSEALGTPVRGRRDPKF